MAELLLDRGENRPALKYCENILTIDPCQEAACRIAMRAYSAMGDRAGVARQYERCREAMAQELNTSPSPETEKLYQRLIGKR
jgi:DNA-binding SARP family transcriptional activator